ncbi:membrane protein [Gordonia phthalatica]|uniref:Membrane protein n=1 Tax=Gordonia phthalatica TaxID=1136941 RepID=A0A0N9N725_9ACTN|nr:membrane protein [Gordonia phthalatica]
MVIFFEILLAAASLLIIWFALYTVYRLVNDES